MQVTYKFSFQLKKWYIGCLQRNMKKQKKWQKVWYAVGQWKRRIRKNINMRYSYCAFQSFRDWTIVICRCKEHWHLQSKAIGHFRCKRHSRNLYELSIPYCTFRMLWPDWWRNRHWLCQRILSCILRIGYLYTATDKVQTCAADICMYIYINKLPLLYSATSGYSWLF